MRFSSIALIVCLLAASADARCRIRNMESADEFNKENHILFAGDHPNQEKAKEAEALHENELEICENNNDPNATEQEALNSFSELTKEEFEAEKTGLKQPTSEEERTFGLIPLTSEEVRAMDRKMKPTLQELYKNLEADVARLPRSYDSRDYGLVTTPKNQANCGSCAAFSATSVLETCWLKVGARMEGLDLSEQFPINCGYDNNLANGCDGAILHVYHKFAADHPEYPHEVQYPYQNDGATLQCPPRINYWHGGAEAESYIADYHCSEDKMKLLVHKFGSVTAGVYAGDDHFRNYKSGVMTVARNNLTNHAVTVVGWGEENHIPYWIVKNSWGQYWGDNGYIKIKRGTNFIHIEETCVALDCTYIGKFDPIPPTPKPKPIPVNLECNIGNFIKNHNLTGNFVITVTTNGKAVKKQVSCKNSVCTPTRTGPSNACMYICGKLEC